MLDGDLITLTQLLKDLTYIGSGGQAKYFLQDETVYVNGELETRRGRKLRAGDQVVISGNEYLITNPLVD